MERFNGTVDLVEFGSNRLTPLARFRRPEAKSQFE